MTSCCINGLQYNLKRLRCHQQIYIILFWKEILIWFVSWRKDLINILIKNICINILSSLSISSSKAIHKFELHDSDIEIVSVFLLQFLLNLIICSQQFNCLFNICLSMAKCINF